MEIVEKPIMSRRLATMVRRALDEIEIELAKIVDACVEKFFEKKVDISAFLSAEPEISESYRFYLDGPRLTEKAREIESEIKVLYKNMDSLICRQAKIKGYEKNSNEAENLEECTKKSLASKLLHEIRKRCGCKVIFLQNDFIRDLSSIKEAIASGAEIVVRLSDEHNPNFDKKGVARLREFIKKTASEQCRKIAYIDYCEEVIAVGRLRIDNIFECTKFYYESSELSVKGELYTVLINNPKSIVKFFGSWQSGWGYNDNERHYFAGMPSALKNKLKDCEYVIESIYSNALLAVGYCGSVYGLSHEVKTKFGMLDFDNPKFEEICATHRKSVQ